MGSSIRDLTDRSESWSNAELDAAWARCADALPVEAREDLVVSFHGPADDRPWVATSWTGDGASPDWGKKGWGDTAVNALRALGIAHVSDVGWWHVTRDDPNGRGPG